MTSVRCDHRDTGYEVVERLPGLVAMWVKLEKEKTGE